MAAMPASVSVSSMGGAGSSSSSPSHSARGGPGLYEFLIEAELQHYYAGIRNDLKIQNVSQLKYVTEEDLHQIGMSKPEMRRLKKFFHKHFPQNYLSKFKKMILPRREEQCRSVLLLPDERVDRAPVRVPNKHIIPAESIHVNKELGMGEFGVVQQGVWANDGERIQVAIKCLSRERMQNNPIEFLKEAAIMHAIDHEHIVRLYGVVLDTSSLMLVTELAPLRSLLECLKEPSLRSSFPVLTLCDFAIQICDGMQYLEFKRLIHRDLAARNILVFSKNKVKISDFGLSRALGVGKDYYQTNFNVNLKLPIAWCAPECITFLRFTSASDVWAYGVTLWEMFSYGFQPWAALTGQQILEAIDEPNFQRLEQADCCPKDYYSIMLKCWQHDPNKRPKFSDLMLLLPECKPEQVQAAQDSVEEASKAKRDVLNFRVGDVITVLDKGPVANVNNCWKGVLNNGKTGYFNPAFTVAYLGSNLPSSTKSEFTRGDGKNTYSSKRRLRPDMISCPQGDLKHTGHVGLDGAYFGDISFLGGKSSSVQYPHLPRQVVSPYKPHEDTAAPPGQSLSASTPASMPQGTSHTRNPSDTSDRAPLLSSKQPGPSTNSSCDWSEPNSDNFDGSVMSKGRFLMDHEYHEISDEENGVDSPRFEKSFDFGPSLLDEMDAMFRTLGACKMPISASPPPPPSSPPPVTEAEEPRDLAHNVRNELREMAARVTGKKKQAMVKPISASDQRTLESAIAMANELASRSMQEQDGGSEASPPPESPHTPASPNKRKFSFKFVAGATGRSSPKAERRNFAEEAASIPDIQSTLTEEARAAYNSLVEAPVLESGSDKDDANPLRMLRSGMAVRARVRGNKQRHTLDRQQSSPCEWANSSSRSLPRPRTNTNPPPPPPTTPAPINRPYGHRRVEMPAPCDLGEAESEESMEDDVSTQDIELSGEESHCVDGNPIPVPPRDRKPQLTNKPRHQRKHPLIIPGEGVTRTIARVSNQLEIGKETQVDIAVEPTSPSQLSDTSSEGYSINRNYMVDDSFENQIACELAALDNIPEEEPMLRTQPPPPLAVPEEDDDDALLRNGDHVSCEDLLDFACDGPNARRTRGPAHGPLSDEVRIMGKVLGKDVSSEECVVALDATNWDVHRAIKVAKLQAVLIDQRPDLLVSCEALAQCSWDVARAAEWVLAAHQDDSDATQV